MAVVREKKTGCSAPFASQLALLLTLLGLVASPLAADAQAEFLPVAADRLHRVTTGVPFPRGLVLVDGTLYVLARGRVRDAGGVDPSIPDHAGTIYAVDPEFTHVPGDASSSDRLAANARVLAQPTEPPFRLLDRSLPRAIDDDSTDRPYCVLRYDPLSRNLFLCAFSGIDLPEGASPSFKKNFADALFRYDLRTEKWHEVERHDPSALDRYPHSDPATTAPPHGWMKGPDNCWIVGDYLYAVAKDNSVLVAYDIREIRKNPDAPCPPGKLVMGSEIPLSNADAQPFLGHSMLEHRDGYLYVGFRTTSQIIRLPTDERGMVVAGAKAELLALFDPWDPQARKSADLTDMCFGPDGNLYVISAKPARVFRFRPDPKHIFDARKGAQLPWADLAGLTGNPKMKSENVLVDARGRVFVTSADPYDPSATVGGTVFRIDP